MNESGYFSAASGSFHTISRPPSRAWSESTERPGSSHSSVPGGPRSLGQEIEHIKKLIARAEACRQQGPGGVSLTAVVFRNRKQEPIAREHIFHELDALKRRIKLEQQHAAERAQHNAHTLERRASQIDPGQESESESEAESVLDERDEELERANEALQVQRERFESLLESAEERVDVLTGQKEGLVREREHLEELLQAGMESTKEKAAVVREKERLAGELGDAQAQLTRATKENSALRNELQVTRERMEELNAKIEYGAKLLQEKSTALDDLQSQKLKTDERHRSAQDEIARLRASKAELETAEKALKDQLQQVQIRCDSLAAETKLHDKAKQDLREKLGAAEARHETAAKHAVELGRKYKEAEKTIVELKSIHAGELDRTKAEEAIRIKKIEDRHSREKAEIQAARADEFQRIRDEDAEKFAALKRQKAGDAEALKSSHLAELERAHADHKQEVELKSDELDIVNRQLVQLSEERETLRKQVASSDEVAKHLQGQIVKQKTQHAEEIEHLKSTVRDVQTKMEEARDVLEQTQAAAVNRESALTSQLSKCETELSELRQSAQATASELKRKVEKLSQELASSQNALRETEKSHASTLARVVGDHEQQLGVAKKLHAQENDHLIAAGDKKQAEAIQSLLEQHSQALKDAAQAHKQKVDQLRLEQDAALSRSKTEMDAIGKDRLQKVERQHTQALQRERQESEKIVAELKASHSRELEQRANEHQVILEKSIREAKADHQRLLNEQLQKSAADLAQTRKANAAEVKRLQSQLQEVQAIHEQSSAELREEHRADIEKLTAKHAREIEASTTESEKKAAELSQSHDSHVLALQEEHQKALTDLKNGHARNAQATEQRQQSLQKAHIEALQSAKDEAAKLEQDHAALAQQHEDQIRDLQTVHSAALSAVQERHAVKAADLERDHHTKIAEEMKNAASAHGVKLQELQIQHDSRCAALESELEHARQEAAKKDDEHNAVAADLHEKHAADSERKLAEHRVELGSARDLATQASAELEAVRAEHAELLDKVRAEHDGVIHAQNAAHQEAITALQKAHENELEKAQNSSSQLQSDMTALRNDHDATILEIREAHLAAIEKVTLEHAKVHEKLAAEHEQERHRLEAKHDEDMAKIRREVENSTSESATAAEVYRTSKQKLQAEYNDEKARLQAQHDAQLQTAERDLEDLRGEISKLGSDHKIALDAVRKEVESMKVELSATAAGHERAIDKLRAAHADELEQAKLNWAAEGKQLSTKHRAETDGLRREIDAAVSQTSEIKIDRDHLLEDVKAKHIAEIKALKAGLAEEVAHREASISAKDAELAEIQLEYDARITSLQAEHSVQIEAVKAEVGESVQHDHNAALVSLRAEHEEQLARLREVGSKSDHDRELEHQAELMTAHGMGKSELEKLRGEHSIALAAAELTHRESLYRMQSDHDQQIRILSEQHQNRLDDLRVTMTQRQAKRENDFDASKQAAAEQQEKLRQEHAKALETARSEGGLILEARLAEAAAKSSAEITTMKFENDKLLSDAESELEKLRRDHEQAIASVKATLEGELDATRNSHLTSVEEIQAAHQSQLDDAKSTHAKLIAEHDNAWTSKMDALRNEHAAAVTALLSKNDTTTASKLEDLEQLHATAISKATEGARREADERAAAADEQHKLALDAAVQKARSASQAEVRNLKKRHQEAMSHIRTTAQRSSAAQIKSLEQAHREAIESALDRAKQAAEHESAELSVSHQEELRRENARALEKHHAETSRIETEHQPHISGLESRLQMEKHAEIQALQARLDATMTGQAEAERSLASLRQQVVNADRRIADAKAESTGQITVLVHEKDDLTTQLEQVQGSLRELQLKQSNTSATPRASVAAHEEVAELHTQLSTLETERSTLKLMLQKRQEEKNEVSRQNEFLVKELEMLLQQRSKSRNLSCSSSDALVQTDANPVEPKADMASFTSIKAARRSSHAARPVTPLSPGIRQAREDVENAWKSRSFEDYLDNARAELFELGSVISANEALFARKIDEHVGELQRAKDELTADYKAKVEGLARDKDTMEKLITSEQHAKFVKDRKKLVAKYGAEFEDSTESSAALTGLPVDTAIELRNAEQQLVNDYNQRITKRKSQIALKHAEEFQTITQDYDRQVSVLLNSRSQLEGDLSVDPSRFEDEYGDITNKSAQLVAERKSNIGAPRSARKSVSPSAGSRHVSAVQNQDPPQPAMPPITPIQVDRSRPRMRTRTSNPRDEQSIPRSSSRPRDFFPGSRDSPEATSQPMKARRDSNKHPPVPRNSLMRTKEAADFFAPTRVASNPSPEPMVPRTPRGRPNSRANPGSNHHSREESDKAQSQQAIFADKRVISLQGKSPNFLRRIKDKISSDVSSPSSPLGRSSSTSGPTPTKTPSAATWRPSHQKGSKSRHFSSGMIYYKDPARHPLPAPSGT